MERIKKGRREPTRDKRENCNVVTSLLDVNGNNIITGNLYEIKGKNHSYMGRVFYIGIRKPLAFLWVAGTEIGISIILIVMANL